MTEPTFLYPEAIMSSEWLAAHLNDPDVRIFECTMYLQYGADGVTARNARPEFDAGHIPGAGYFDLQCDLSDQSPDSFRFAMPSPDVLAAKLGEMGIGDGHRVVLYSRDTLQWSTRVWWMLHAIGLEKISILDGGFHTWVAEGRPVSAAPANYPPASVTARPRAGAFIDKDEVLDAIDAEGICTINALTADIHRGDNERYGRAGRIPGSVNVPAASLQNADSLKINSPAEVARAFANIGAEQNGRVIVYCGGGVAATLDAFLLRQLGYNDITVYDNSMTEWANDPEMPMEVDS
ncbi:MAG: hypothetical protein CMF67_05485 [Magnetovibrio sp.]|nr:hypothetical protein [Magnetovibrio sp.]